jgi:hypothetical protein
MAKIERKLDADHLYYSCTLTGSSLTRAQIEEITER